MKYGDATKNWTVELDGKEHRFRMEHNFWSGEKRYYVNEKPIGHADGNLKESASFGSTLPFDIDGHRGYFQHRALGRLVFYDLYIDGRKIQGEEQHALRAPPWVIIGALLLLFLLAFLVMPSE